MKSNPNILAGRETKPHIGIYGRCNAGKSTLLNFITAGDFAVVSEQAGTTTDPVRKSYEILDFAPVIFIDTAGSDDTSELGGRRMQKTLETVSQIDLALLVFREWGLPEQEMAARLEHDGVPFIPIYNDFGKDYEPELTLPLLRMNVKQGTEDDRNRLLEAIKTKLPEQSYVIPSMFDGRAAENDLVLLVCPIDSEAPSGRMILPQVQAIRHLLDKHAMALVIQPEQITTVFSHGIHPKLVVTDSQAFAEVKKAVPSGIEITSFSILLAQLKGDYTVYEEGLHQVDSLKAGDRVLILENCIHQTSCEDIGRVKIPRLLEKHIGGGLDFTVVSGLTPLPADLEMYNLAVQCGGCMVTRSQLQNRIRAVRKAGVPVTNYGMLLNKLL